MPPTGYLNIELGFDQAAFRQPGCCHFVQVALRICDISKDARLMVTFQRIQASGDQEYEVSPHAGHFQRKAISMESYREYITPFLCRSHASETGTIALLLLSDAFLQRLLDLVIHFDTRKPQPTLTLKKGQVKAFRFLPRLRSLEARDALQGHYPALPTKLDHHLEHQIPLFPES